MKKASLIVGVGGSAEGEGGAISGFEESKLSTLSKMMMMVLREMTILIKGIIVM